MASFYGGGHGDYLQAVVADIGQAYTKVGWAGNDAPKAYFRSVRVFSSAHVCLLFCFFCACLPLTL
jgi:hypothetical protein